jgi:hypothetical protein
MIYLASPYSHPDPAIQEERYQKALHAVYYYAQNGLTVYSPIVHWHHVAAVFGLPKDAAFWEAQNLARLERASQFIVLNISGWKESKGVTQELTWAEDLNIPVSFTDPEERKPL